MIQTALKWSLDNVTTLRTVVHSKQASLSCNDQEEGYEATLVVRERIMEELTVQELAELQSAQQKALLEEEEKDGEKVGSYVIRSSVEKWNQCQDCFEKHTLVMTWL
ncbi:hypothetical protein H920_03956 [Fukomys damarensis]|uniref:Uncharacterized protein n=1 Tax=Fukomys damarensis TaxID=885580 RepID=A0A091DVS8_FUKDA|nr:hypothetical protein H920_03956 [Fukomys damarensis]